MARSLLRSILMTAGLFTAACGTYGVIPTPNPGSGLAHDMGLPPVTITAISSATIPAGNADAKEVQDPTPVSAAFSAPYAVIPTATPDEKEPSPPGQVSPESDEVVGSNEVAESSLDRADAIPSPPVGRSIDAYWALREAAGLLLDREPLAGELDADSGDYLIDRLVGDLENYRDLPLAAMVAATISNESTRDLKLASIARRQAYLGQLTAANASAAMIHNPDERERLLMELSATQGRREDDVLDGSTDVQDSFDQALEMARSGDWTTAIGLAEEIPDPYRFIALNEIVAAAKQKLDNPISKMYALIDIAAGTKDLGNGEFATEVLWQAVVAARDIDVPADRAQAAGEIAWAATQIATAESASALLGEAMDIGIYAEGPFDRATAFNQIAWLAIGSGDLQFVQTALQRAEEAARKVEDPVDRAEVLGIIGGTAARSGNRILAGQLFEEALKAANEIQDLPNCHGCGDYLRSSVLEAIAIQQGR